MCIHVNTTPNPSDATIGQWTKTLGMSPAGTQAFLEALAAKGIGSEDPPEKLDSLNFGGLLQAIQTTLTPADLRALQYAFDDIEEARGKGPITNAPPPHGSKSDGKKRGGSGPIVGAIIGLLVVSAIIFGVFKLRTGGKTQMYTISMEPEDRDGEADDDVLLG